MEQHADFLWFLLIGSFTMLGAAASIISALFSRANKAEMGAVKIEIGNVKDGQRELKESMIRVHSRIDDTKKEIACVDGKVNRLEGKTETIEKLFGDRVRVNA